MTERSALSELAAFVGRSPLSSANEAVRRRALDGLVARLAPQTHRRTVTELLGAVLALSARTRRAALPPAAVDLDVFSPDGRRAVNLELGRRR
ncbi:hypothetical protein [Devosia nitrariae]|uniref:Uncharacterized protein n=1 Tax=Devosia nitrariae TaxID=2071872 RepID=A0ABQ5WBL0_9HYPH|nr:hypothetical protein [Devosia nitrariae]GLQ57489.1 hypothetical protein GCM10010862_47480 [Devosia nitrariae]